MRTVETTQDFVSCVILSYTIKHSKKKFPKQIEESLMNYVQKVPLLFVVCLRFAALIKSLFKTSFEGLYLAPVAYSLLLF